MINITVDKNKVLSISSSVETYEGEHLAEQIRVSLPTVINNIDITDCKIYLHYINTFGLGNVIELTEKFEKQTDYMVCQDNITNIFTAHSGALKIYIEIKNFDTGFTMKTGYVEYVVNPHCNFDKAISKQTFTLLEQFIARYEQLLAQGGVNPDGNPNIDMSDFVTKEMLKLYALKATTLSEYGITDGVTTEAFQKFSETVSTALAELSQGIADGDENTLDEAKNYTDEVVGSSGGSVTEEWVQEQITEAINVTKVYGYPINARKVAM